jgi:cytochrome b involved in lipid metabolism
MKLIKNLFIISLLNLAILASVLFFTPAPQTVPIPQTALSSEKCVIVIDGLHYDVTSFRNQHPGGDVFVCGTDMSTLFHSQHPQSFLKKLSKYQI